MSLLKSLQFVWNQEFRKFTNSGEAVRIRHADSIFDCDLYPEKGKFLGCILFVHGMSIHGRKDVRIANLASALSASGYRVIVPEFDDIAKLQVHRGQPEQIANACRALCYDRQLCRNTNPGVMAPSFSASLVLKASTAPDLANHLAALCLIGGYAEIDSTLEYLLSNPEADEYGRLVVIYNYIEQVLGEQKALREALRQSIIYNASRKDADLDVLNQSIATLDDLMSVQYDRIMNDPAWRMELKDQILVSPETQKDLAAINVMPVLDQVHIPVSLIHGRFDNVISADQSILLHKKLQSLGRQSRLCITELISHGDTGSVLSMVPDAWALIQNFAWFFDQIKRRNQIL
ncbi:MAG: alpha/beta hydrolase [Leptospiraceae bacterium]|nr:alpha/beta hydrolase [Leptospiraceae bacterium]